MPAKFFNILALSTLVILVCSFGPSQTFALSVRGDHNLARHLPNHHGIAKKKKKRDNCKPRPSSSYPPAVTPASQPTNPPAQGGNDLNYSPTSSLPPSTTSSTSPPSTTPTNTPSTTPHTGTGKLGIAWAMGDDPRVSFLLSSSRTVIFHLWSASIPAAVKNSGIDVSIMLWSLSGDRVADWLDKAKPGYATHAYGFNEVNQFDQAYMSVGDAVSGWYQYIRPLANQGYTLGSPCTTSAPDGLQWVTEFVSQCGDDCHIDEITAHFYDVHFEDFQDYIQKWVDAFKKPVRITEFACQNFNGGAQPSMDDIWYFTVQTINWLDSYDPVLSYAPFGFMDDMYNVNYDDKLFADNNLSALGWLYVNGHA